MPADEVERWRVFLAIEVPEAVRGALTAPLDALGAAGESLRINPVDRIHLTLHFLGHQPRPMIERLQPLLAATIARHQRFRLVTQGVGAFPDIRRPRVVWAGIAGAARPRLSALQGELGAVLRGAGLTADDRFDPHLTLARVRRPLRANERQLVANWSIHWGSVTFGEVPVDQVRLMRSQLGGGPPRYTTLATFDLQ